MSDLRPSGRKQGDEDNQNRTLRDNGASGSAGLHSNSPRFGLFAFLRKDLLRPAELLAPWEVRGAAETYSIRPAVNVFLRFGD
jgi:hypothetical protein